MLHDRFMRAARSLALLCLALFAAAPAGADQITDSARTIWRDYTVDGVPTSGAWNPRKGDIRTFGALVGSSISALQAAQTGAALAFDTKANLDASLAYAANTQAFVYADATPDNNGIYRKNGASGAGSWTKVSALVYGPTPTFGLGTVTVTACNTSPAAALGGTALAPVLNFSFPSCNYDGAIPLPTPTTTTRGGVVATPLVTHQFVTGIDTADGGLIRAQPVAGDLGDIAADTYLGNAGAAPAAPAAVSRSNCNGATKALNYTAGSGESCNSAIHATTSDTVTTNANLTGDVTSVGNATTIANNAVTNAKAAQMAAESFKCNNTGSTANPIDCTVAEAKTLLGLGALSDDGTFINSSKSIDLAQNAIVAEIANAGTTGTTINYLAKLTGGTAIITSTADTDGAIGVVVGGAGTTGNAKIATSGVATCQFDGATTAGHYVTISTSVTGKCRDAGSARPTVQVIGRVLSTNGAAGAYLVALQIAAPSLTGAGSDTVVIPEVYDLGPIPGEPNGNPMTVTVDGTWHDPSPFTAHTLTLSANLTHKRVAYANWRILWSADHPPAGGGSAAVLQLYTITPDASAPKVQVAYKDSSTMVNPGIGNVSNDAVDVTAAFNAFLDAGAYGQFGWQYAGNNTAPAKYWKIRLEVGWLVK